MRIPHSKYKSPKAKTRRKNHFIIAMSYQRQRYGSSSMPSISKRQKDNSSPDQNASSNPQPDRQVLVHRPSYAGSCTDSTEKYEKILLITNHYEIKIPAITCYVYDIRIIPVKKNQTGHYVHIFNANKVVDKKRLKKLVNEHNRHVMQKIVDSFCKPGMMFHDATTNTKISPVFDGMYNFYTTKPLTGVSRNSTSTTTSSSVRDRVREYIDIEVDPGNPCSFEVNIHYSTSVDLNLINNYISGMRDNGSQSAGAGGDRQPLLSSPPLDSLKAMDIILRHGPTINRIPIDKALYSQDGESYRLPMSENKDVIYGHFQSVRAKECGATLNIDQISAVFFTPGPLLEIIARMDAVNSDADSPPDVQTFMEKIRSNHFHHRKAIDMLTKSFKNLAVVTDHEKLPYKRKFKVKQVTSDPANKLYFHLNPSDSHSSVVGHTEKVTVASYYESKYGITLKYPDLPCLMTGTFERPCYFPLELVHLQPKQQTTMLSNKERKYIMDVSGKQTTEKRFANIDRAAKTVIADSEQQLNEFSITMSDEAIRVDGNIIQHPYLDFGDGISFKPKAGKWDMNGKKLYRPAESGLKDWLVINLHAFGESSERRRCVNHFVRGLMRTGSAMGLKMSEPFVRCKHTSKYASSKSGDDDTDDLFEDMSDNQGLGFGYMIHEVMYQRKMVALRKSHQSHSAAGYSRHNYPTTSGKWEMAGDYRHIKAIMFIIEDRKDEHYLEIKSLFDIKVPLMSQVVFSKNVIQMDDVSHVTFLQNLILKMNTKLGGINCLISNENRLRTIVDRYTMIMGADVTHPALSDSVPSSIACVTASVDREQYFYEVELSVQLSYKEMITDMFDMSCKLIHKFCKRRERMPSKIIFFRDGVSEGQFDQVMREEVTALRQACDKIRKDYGCKDPLPSITVIIVRKRHHTRFTPVNPEQGVGRTHNVPAGTAVDTKVVSPMDFDFYLSSHEAAIGTTRPTHYVVLVDENKLTPEEIFRITFNLCHLFPPTTKSISIPIPVQYAHLAAKRARAHAIAADSNGKLGGPKRKHPSEMERVTRVLNDAIRVPDRDPDDPVNMYYI